MTTDQTARQVHTGSEHCPVRPLHDPCHTGCSEDGRTLDDMTATSMWIAWRRQIRGTPAVPDDPYHPPGSCDACASPPGQVPLPADASGHDLSRRQIAGHGTDRYPFPAAQYAKVLDEAGELGEAMMEWFSGSDPVQFARVRAEYADVGLALYALGDKLGIDLIGAMRELVDADTRTFTAFPPESGMTRQDVIDNGIIG